MLHKICAIILLTAMEATKELIKNLIELRSSTGGTSLVTMLIPSKYNLSIVTTKLTTELSTATNIKDKLVRSSTITALKSAIGALRMSKLHTAPENGLVLCAGEPQYCL